MNASALLRMARAGLVAGALAILYGCAGPATASRTPANPDPLEPVNRVIFRINDIGDRYVGKPVAQAYEKGTPGFFRTGTSNFLGNLRYPITIVNDVLQGKIRQGGQDLARFALNSTVGLFGLLDPASEVGLAMHDEDFGQTLAVWGVPQGPYLVVPIFGPRTLTSGIGDLADTQFSPLHQWPGDVATRNALIILYLVNTRYSLLPLDEQVQQAFDPYAFVRDAYLQNRLFRIYDGHPPEEDLYPEDDDTQAQ
ncbi:MAG: VacJ family lipoprotein [Gammaproteobacteria bacterium]|nr:VacJ family lipoprotein [Gammaproteobacteria bacterium]